MVCCQNGRTYLVLLGPALVQCALHLGDLLGPLTSPAGMETLMCDFIGSPPWLLPASWDAQRGQMLLALVVPLVVDTMELLLLLEAGVWWLAPHTRASLGQANRGSNTTYHCCPRWLRLLGAGGRLGGAACPLSTTTTGNVRARAPG